MRCLHCGANSRYRERKITPGCPACGVPFVFEPRLDGMTDLAFSIAVQRVSGDGAVRWHRDQLFYELCRVRDKRRIKITGRTMLSRTLMGKLMARWATVQPLPGLIDDPVPAYAPSPQSATEIDGQSFTDVIVCDQALLAAFLLANDVHLERRCPVLAADGYPASSRGPVLDLVRAHPPARVWALHDASPAGCRLPHALATDPDWFGREAAAGETAVLDLGLMPAQAGRFKGVWDAADERPADLPGLTAKERRWLKRHRLRTAAVSPPMMLARVGRAVGGSGHDVPDDLIGAGPAPTASPGAPAGPAGGTPAASGRRAAATSGDTGGTGAEVGEALLYRRWVPIGGDDGGSDAGDGDDEFG